MNIIPRSAKAGALLFFANYKLERIVKNETIDYSLSYMLGRNESSCVVFHVIVIILIIQNMKLKND